MTKKKSEDNMSVDKCFYISIHYRFQNGPFIRMHAESRERALRATTVFLSHCQNADAAAA